MKRRRLTRLQKVRLFDRDHGLCHLCGLRIQVGQPWEISHKQSLWAKGADDLANLGPAHKKPCHRRHTDAEAGERAKETRIRANFLGIPKPSKTKFACGKDSTKRKKMSGEVVNRVSQASEHRRVMESRVIR